MLTGPRGLVQDKPLDRIDRLLGILLAVRRLDHLVDDMHAVIGADRREGELLGGADGLRGRLDEALVLRRVVGHRVMEGRQQPEGPVAESRQVGFLRQVAWREELDAGLLQARVVEGLHEAERGRPGRQEGEHALGAGTLARAA